MAKKSVNVCDERHSFDGALQKLMSTIFCKMMQKLFEKFH